MTQIESANQKTHVFTRFNRPQSAANLGSAGQLREGRHSNHAVTINSNAEKIKIQPLCCDKVTNIGNWLISPASTAPKPRLTNISGNTQQSNVPRDKNNVRNVTPAVFISFTMTCHSF